MILGIDVGNTDIVTALLESGKVIKEHRYPTDKNENADYHKKNIEKLTCNHSVSAVIISCVVPEVRDNLTQVCIQLFGLTPLFVSSELDTGLMIKYDNPEKLGADLISVAAGAVNKYGAPVLVIDVGTATTFSVINGNKEYLGGMIAAGPYTSMKALSAMTSQLTETELEPTDKIIGTNTADCIKIGTLTAHSAMIDSMIDRVGDSLGVADIKVVATGGLSKLLIPMCTHKIIYDNDLIFSGLYEIYKLNCK